MAVNISISRHGLNLWRFIPPQGANTLRPPTEENQKSCSALGRGLASCAVHQFVAQIQGIRTVDSRWCVSTVLVGRRQPSQQLGLCFKQDGDIVIAGKKSHSDKRQHPFFLFSDLQNVYMNSKWPQFFGCTPNFWGRFEGLKLRLFAGNYGTCVQMGLICDLSSGWKATKFHAQLTNGWFLQLEVQYYKGSESFCFDL